MSYVRIRGFSGPLHTTASLPTVWLPKDGQVACIDATCSLTRVGKQRHQTGSPKKVCWLPETGDANALGAASADVAAAAGSMMPPGPCIPLRSALYGASEFLVGLADGFGHDVVAEEFLQHHGHLCWIELAIFECVSAWNIDPSGGVTGVQF